MTRVGALSFVNQGDQPGGLDPNTEFPYNIKSMQNWTAPCVATAGTPSTAGTLPNNGILAFIPSITALFKASAKAVGDAPVGVVVSKAGSTGINF